MSRTLISIAILVIIFYSPQSFAADDTSDDFRTTVSLIEALDIAMASNLELQAASEGLAAARFGVKAAKALDWFSLSAAGSSAKSGPEISQEIPGQGEIVISPSTWQHTLSVTLSQPIFTFGLNKNLKKVPPGAAMSPW